MPVITDEINLPRIKFPSQNFIITRYMDLPKFLSLISTSKLFLARLDLLEDKYEGTMPPTSFDLLVRSFSNFQQSGDFNNDNLKTPSQSAQEVKDALKDFKKMILINSWSKFYSENYALWKVFARTDTGIMIKSNISNLSKYLSNESRKLWLSEVIYLDPNKDSVEHPGNLAQYVIHKNNAFKYEEEVRLMFSYDDEKGYDRLTFDWDSQENKYGIYIKIDLNILIDEIILGPDCQDWYVEIITSLCKKYNIDKPIRNSSLKYNEE